VVWEKREEVEERERGMNCTHKKSWRKEGNTLIGAGGKRGDRKVGGRQL